jgi:hypothetical protein
VSPITIAPFGVSLKAAQVWRHGPSIDNDFHVVARECDFIDALFSIEFALEASDLLDLGGIQRSAGNIDASYAEGDDEQALLHLLCGRFWSGDAAPEPLIAFLEHS